MHDMIVLYVAENVTAGPSVMDSLRPRVPSLNPRDVRCYCCGLYNPTACAATTPLLVVQCIPELQSRLGRGSGRELVNGLPAMVTKGSGCMGKTAGTRHATDKQAQVAHLVFCQKTVILLHGQDLA